MQKAKERYSKEKAAECYSQNKEAIKEKLKNWHKNLSQEDKDKIKEYQRKRYQLLIQYKKEALLSIRMSEKKLKFDNIRLNKKEFHKSKQPINLDFINTGQIVIFDKFKHSDYGFKYFIGYKEGEIIKPLCVVLPQMSGYIKYFENGGKSMSFVIKDDDVLDKHNESCGRIKGELSIKFRSRPIFDKKYIKAKVREFKPNLLGDEKSKENMRYTCISCILLWECLYSDFVMRMEKRVIHKFIYWSANTV